MKALWLEDGSLSVRDLPEPEPGPGEALLKLRVAAFGPVEREIIGGQGAFRGIPGREFVAEVISSDSPQLTGRRVVGSGLVGCGVCRYCLRDEPRYCPSPLYPGLNSPGGCFAEYFCLPEASLRVLPHPVRDYDAVMAYALAAGLAAGEYATRYERILVVGRRARAMAAAIALKNRNCHVFATIHDKHATVALKRFKVQRDPGGVFPFVAACPADGAELDEAMRRVEPEGTLALLPGGYQPLCADLARVVAKGLTCVGFPRTNLDLAMERLHRRELCEALSRARDAVFPLEKGVEAAAAAAVDPLTVLIDNLSP